MVDKIRRADRDPSDLLRGFDIHLDRAVSSSNRAYGLMRRDHVGYYPTGKPRVGIERRGRPIISSNKFDNILMVVSRTGGFFGGLALGSFVESISDNLGIILVGAMAGFLAASASLESLGKIYYNRLRRIESQNEGAMRDRTGNGNTPDQN